MGRRANVRLHYLKYNRAAALSMKMFNAAAPFIFGISPLPRDVPSDTYVPLRAGIFL